MAADFGQVGKASVSVDADLSSYDAAMASLPTRASAKLKEAEQKIRAGLALAGANLRAAEASGDPAAIAKSAAAYELLANKLKAVQDAAIRQAQAMQQAARQAAVLAGQGAIIGNQFVSFTTRATAAQGALGGIGKGAGNAANRLQVLAQGFDDLQYVPEQGLRPILNNLVQLSPALGIAAIGVSVLYTNWDKIAQVWRSEETIKEAERQKELAAATEAAAAAYEHEAQALKGIKGQVTDVRANAATSASNQVGPNQAIAEIAGAMKRGNTFTPGIPIEDQAKQLLINARTGDLAANSRLEALINSDGDRNGAFSNAYRLHQLQNPTGQDKLDQDANKRAAATAAFMSNEAARKEKERRDEEDKRVKDYADHASTAARRQVLEATASGSDLDKGMLSEKIAENLVTSGVDPKDAGDLATKVADKLAETLDKKLTDDAVKNGTSKSKAAQAGLVDLQVEGAKRFAEAMRVNLDEVAKEIKDPKVMSSDELNKTLLAARPKSAEEIAKKQLDEAQKTVRRLEEIRDNLTRGVPARVGGP